MLAAMQNRLWQKRLLQDAEESRRQAPNWTGELRDPSISLRWNQLRLLQSLYSALFLSPLIYWKNQGETNGFFTLMISEIFICKVQVSFDSKTWDMSDILALIEHLQFPVGQIHFTGFALFISMIYVSYRNRFQVLWLVRYANCYSFWKKKTGRLYKKNYRCLPVPY